MGIKNICFLLLAIATLSCKDKPNFNALSEVSYTTDIAPIIGSNCTFSGCHGDVTPKKFKLNSYNTLIEAGIKKGSPETSELYETLKTLKEEKRMPKKPYSSLTEKQIQLVYVWIGQGAKNN